MKPRPTRRYVAFTDEFEKGGDPAYTLPKGYRWTRTDLLSRILSGLIYGAAVLFSSVYCGAFLRLRVRGREKLKGQRGFFLYGNHTQPVGDVFTPALCVLPRRIYTIVSPANFSLPGIGPILPYLGALPTAADLRGIRALEAAVDLRLGQGHPIVVYPEAHVWEYYTGIRPFPATAFKMAVKREAPSFAMTVTYRQSGLRKRPLMEVFLDGPFYGRGESPRQRADDLCAQVRAAMEMRSRNSDCEWIRYERADDVDSHT